MLKFMLKVLTEPDRVMAVLVNAARTCLKCLLRSFVVGKVNLQSRISALPSLMWTMQKIP